MRTGDLVLVGPVYDDSAPCIVIDLKAFDWNGKHLPDCVTIHVFHNKYTIPMDKKWIKVISESRGFNNR